MNGYKPEGTLPGETVDTLTPLPILEKYKERGKIIEAPVLLCDNDMNLHVMVGNIPGIIPREEVVYSPGEEQIKDIAILTRVGKTVACKITGITERNGSPFLILSRRAAQIECYEAYISRLLPGDIIPARVTHLENFGVFLDVGCGIISLLSVDCLSVSRISHPKHRLAVGDEIRVVVRSADAFGRIYVSKKELLGTWEENAALFSPGQTVPGIVRSIEPYGVFVELTPNLAGLAEIRDDVAENDTAIVFIKSILPERMKIKLVIIDAQKSGSLPRQPMKDFPSVTGISHMDRWQYSPACASRVIETIFA